MPYAYDMSSYAILRCAVSYYVLNIRLYSNQQHKQPIQQHKHIHIQTTISYYVSNTHTTTQTQANTTIQTNTPTQTNTTTQTHIHTNNYIMLCLSLRAVFWKLAFPGPTSPQCSCFHFLKTYSYLIFVIFHVFDYSYCLLFFLRTASLGTSPILLFSVLRVWVFLSRTAGPSRVSYYF